MVLFLPAADSLDVEDFAEVRVATVCDVDQVCLDQGFRRRWLDLEGFEEGFYLSKAGVDPFYEAGWCWCG